MKAALFTSVLCLFSGLVSSTPVPTPEDSAIEARYSGGCIYPTLIVPLYESAPWHSYGPSNRAVVARSNGYHNVYSLLQYTLPDGLHGKTCKFFFRDQDSSSGTQKVQLFTVGQHIEPYNTFSHRPYRDQYKATFTVQPGSAEATWDDGVPTFPCPDTTTTLNYEVVPQGDNDEVSWFGLSEGLCIYPS